MISVVVGWVSVFWGVGLCNCIACAACVMSHVSILRSGVCPSVLYLSIFDRFGDAVAPGWNPMRSSLIEAFGSRSVFVVKEVGPCLVVSLVCGDTI
jgi:hypothetical protein